MVVGGGGDCGGRAEDRGRGAALRHGRRRPRRPPRRRAGRGGDFRRPRDGFVISGVVWSWHGKSEVASAHRVTLVVAHLGSVDSDRMLHSMGPLQVLHSAVGSISS